MESNKSTDLHTPGPWVCFADRGRTVAVMPAGRDGDICELDDDRPQGESNANGRLIAAAPDMLVALHWAKQALTHDAPSSCWATGPLTGDPIEDLVVCPGCRALNAIDAAMAKAKEESHV